VSLQEYAWLAQIVSALVNLLLVSISTGVAIYVYKWHREVARLETSSRFQEALRSYNELVLENDEMQDLTIQTHPWGSLEKTEVVRMYRYFLWLNISVALYDAKIRNAVDKPTYESHINNTANLTFKDREFIKQHVLPRGYPKAFREELMRRWNQIDKGGSLGPA
jgi:hypothetical protein